MKIIGLTGNIGSGKSTVGRILKSLGCLLIDADYVGRLIAEPGLPANEALQREFGREYFDAENNLNRRKLGAYVFADEEALRRLDALLHPYIIEEIKRLIAENRRQRPEQVIVIEAAILIEAGMLPLIDSLWVVAAEDRLRIERVKVRDQLTEASVIDRMKRQMAQSEKLEYADFVIWNNSDEAALRTATAEIWQRFREKYGLGDKSDDQTL